MALDNVSEKETFRATDLMNNRPRKCLGSIVLLWRIQPISATLPFKK
jgi:hypothetical protein